MHRIFLALALITISVPALAVESLDHYFSFMGFKLEEVELSEIESKLGNALTHQKGDAAYSYTAICYRIPKNRVTVYFESGEMGGGRTLLSYRVVEEADPDFTCGQSNSEVLENYNTGVLAIGNDIDKTIGLLPGGIESREGLLFLYHTKIPFTEAQIKKFEVQDMNYAYWDQSVTIELFPINNSINGFRVTKVTSW